MSGVEQGDPDARSGLSDVHYRYKASLIGSLHQFDLTMAGLSWRIGSRSGLWRYQDIAAVRLSFKPVAMQARRFRADVVHRNGSRLLVLSTSWETVTLMAPQDQSYRDFVLGLHQRMQEAGSRAELTGGLKPVTYGFAMLFLAMLGLALGGLLVRALATGQSEGALFVVGFALLFIWQVGGFVRRNWPVHYSFDQVPATLLP